MSEKYIICRICKKHFQQITVSHIATHDMNFSEYLEKYPDASYCVSSIEKIRVKANKKARENPTINSQWSKRLRKARKRQIISEEQKEKTRTTMLRVGRTPEFRRKVSRGVRWVYAHTNLREKLSKLESGKGNHFYDKHHTAETKAIISRKLKGKFAGRKHQYFGKERELETRLKISQTLKAKHLSGKKSPTYHRMHTLSERKRMSLHHPDSSGEKNPMFHDWSSRQPYCKEWGPELKERIARKFNHTCKFCGRKTRRGEGCPHHINYNKQDCRDINLVWVHLKCNDKFNGDPNYWFAYFCKKLKINPKKLFTKEYSLK